MITILAMALVGLLSISSLAEARSVNKTPKPERAQRSPSSDELTCPEDFVKIKGAYRGPTDFCISKKVEGEKTWRAARSNCKDKKNIGREQFLCTRDQWELACKQQKKELLMPDYGREWVSLGGNYDFIDNETGQFMGGNLDCDSFF